MHQIREGQENETSYGAQGEKENDAPRCDTRGNVWFGAQWCCRWVRDGRSTTLDRGGGMIVSPSCEEIRKRKIWRAHAREIKKNGV